MSKVYFISDLHLGHEAILKVANKSRAKIMGISNIKEHDEMIFDKWNDTVTKRDKIFVLGDIGKFYKPIKKLPGNKVLILGNHDIDPAKEYLDVFGDIYGTRSYKNYWLSHFPVTSAELYGRHVIHGHTHMKGVENPMYTNVCIEMCNAVPVDFEDIKSRKFTTWERVNTLGR